MDDPSPSAGCEALLSQAGWVRELARHLTADAHAADDLAQDAIAAALVRPPPGDRPLRGWLAGIVRNLARDRRRSASNRAAREREAARRAAEPSGEDLLERLESHRVVVEAVARLAEPYRTAILLRYFEGLSPSAIAARTGSPLRTVHTRLHRALGELRADLDRSHGGDRRAWLLALIPFARGSREWSLWGAGALVMDAKLKIALAALAVVGICSTLVMLRSEEAPRAAEVAASSPSADATAPVDASGPSRALEAEPTSHERRAQEIPSAPAPVEAPAAASAALVGRVIDVEGGAVAGVIVRCSASSAGSEHALESRTDPDGAFAIQEPPASGHLDVASPGWASVFRPDLPARAGKRELVLVVARTVSLAGVVVDETLRPLPGAALSMPMPYGLRSRFDAILDGSSAVERSTKAGPDGRFELEDVPAFEGAVLSTRHPLHLEDVRMLPSEDEPALQIVLRAAGRGPERLTGVVVDLEGNPVENAWVGMGGGSTKSDSAGRFSLGLQGDAEDSLRFGGSGTEPLRALKPGYLPGELARPIGEGAWPDPLVLRLGGPTPTIEGRVVDAEGAAVPNALVWIDRTRFGLIEIEGGEMQMTAGATIEGILGGDPWTRRFSADAEGRFELRGLLQRDYVVHALDTDRLLAAEATLAAGSRNVEIRLPKEALHERVAGRVTSLGGEPVEGVRVTLERGETGEPVPEFDRLESRSAKTDAEGRFEFEKVSRAAGTVCVRGAGLDLMGVRRPIRPGDDVEELVIAVPLRVHVQVDAGGSTEFDHVEVLDGAGEKLYLSVDHGKSSYAMHEVHLQEGRTEVFSVSEAGTTLVLYKEKKEVRRMPLELVPGELNSIRP